MIQLGPFELVEPIGAGGMGEIWRGRHLDQDVEVAVKIVRPQAGDADDFEALFANEVEAVASLHHPGIVCVYDYGKISAAAAKASQGRLPHGSPYLVMELASHGSLFDWPRPTSWLELRHTLLQILDSLAHAHAHLLYHCDLKPGNVLVTGAEPTRLKLTDFGLAQLTVSKTSPELSMRPGSSAGTPGYMAPEQIHGRWREIGPWTDLYALGCMVYSLATGRLPFVHPSAMRMLLAHLQDEPEAFKPLFNVPEELESWVAKLLEKSPGARFARAADAAHALWTMNPVTQDTQGLPDDSPQSALAMAEPETLPIELRTLTVLFTEVIDKELLFGSTAAAMPALSMEAKSAVSEVPPMPTRWEVETHVPPEQLSGTGLGIFRMRRVGFIGREEERSAIWNELSRVRHEGRPRVLVLSGPAGCGKTALAHWMASRADELGAALVLRANHSLAGGTREGLPRMLAIFLRANGLAGHELEAFLAERLDSLLPSDAPEDARGPDTAGLAAFIAPGPDGFSESARKRHHLALLGLLSALARERPIFLCLDDVQWGSHSLEFVETLLARKDASLPIFCLLTVRDESLVERPSEEQTINKILLMEKQVSRRVVAPLAPDKARELIRQLLPLDDDLVEDLAARTAGNPLFALELLGDWVERGILVPYAGGYRTREATETTLPDSIHEVWTGRIERLLERYPDTGDEVRVVIELAACFGQYIDRNEWELASRIAGFSHTRSLIKVFADARLITGNVYKGTFTHEMLRESILRMAREAGRLPGHHRICLEAIDRLYPDSGHEIVERRAQHLLGAGMLDEAVDALLAAAREHYQGLFVDKVTSRLAALAERALNELGVGKHDPRWVTLWTVSGWSQVYTDPHAASRLLDRASSLADPTHHALDLAEIARARAYLARQQGDLNEATRQQEKAYGHYQNLNHKTGMLKCLATLGTHKNYTGENELALSYFQAGLDVFKDAPDVDSRWICECLRGLGRTWTNLGEYDKARPFLEQALDVAEQSARDARMLVHAELGELARKRGAFDDAELHCRACWEYHREIGAPNQHLAALNLAIALIHQKRFEEAQHLCIDAARGIEARGSSAFIGGAYALLLCCAAGLEQWDLWDTYFEAGHAALETTPIVQKDFGWATEHAARLAETAGEVQRAKKVYRLAAIQWEPIDKRHAESLRGRSK